ncbi:MAG: NUDIX hydrolase [Bacillota bacterium]|nr:NUDIX hydrolase [Bacillota bacterium]
MREIFIQQLQAYIPFNEQEERDRDLILAMVESHEDIFTRENSVAHITSSAWVTNKEHTKVLMAYHNLYDSWAWLGGHNDGNEDCLAVAIKEVKEESGIQEVIPVSKQIFSVEVLTVDGHIKKGKYVSSHLHLNVTYLLEADDTLEISNKEDENSAVGWFTLDQAVEKSTEPWFKENVYSKLNKKLRSSNYS